MQTLLILFGILLAVGLFMLLANALKIPYLKTSKAVMNTGREDKKISKNIEAIMLGIAAKLGKIIPMDKYKKTRLENTLKASSISTRIPLPIRQPMTVMMDSARRLFPIRRSAPLLHGAFGARDGLRIGYGFRAGAGILFAMRTAQRVVTGRITDIGKIRANGSFIRIPIPYQ